MTKPSIFIASSVESLDVANALSYQLRPDAFVTVWTEGVFSPGKAILETLTDVANQSDFAIIILSPDDLTEPHNSSKKTKDNLFFELGFLIGRLGRSRTFLITEKSPNLGLPTDISTIDIAHFETPFTQNISNSINSITQLIKKAIADLGPRNDRSIDYYSCFISYASQDKEFALKLHDDLQKVGVKCWLDVKDLRIGEKLVSQIDRAILEYDKVLLVLSAASINSNWVKHEIKNGFELEQKRNKTILFPIRIDNAIFESTSNYSLNLIKDNFIVDFSNWNDQKSYQLAFKHLVRDLLISTSIDIEGQK
jgi:hypothetical protein